MKHLRKVPYIEQMQQTECGLCCIAMILKYYKSNETLGNIRDELEVGRDGLKLAHMERFFHQRGIETNILQMSSDELLQVKLPAIVLWDKEQYVVLESINKKEAVIVDPAYGKIKKTFEEFKDEYLNVVMTVTPTKMFVPKKRKHWVWGSLLKRVGQRKEVFLKTAVISIITYSIQLILPILIESMIDLTTKGTDKMQVKYCIYFVLATILIYGVMSFIRQKSVIDLQMEIDTHLTKGTFTKLMRLPYKYFESRANGDLLFRLNSLNIIRDLISHHIITGVIQLGYAIVIIGYLLDKSVMLTLVTMGIFLGNGLFIFVMRPRILEANQYQIIENTKLQSIQTETIYSIFGVKASGMESDVENNWNDKYQRSMRAYKKKNVILNVYQTIISIFQTVGPFFVLLLGLKLCTMGKLTIGGVIASYSLASIFISTSVSLFNMWNDFNLASSYLERINDITEAKEEVKPEKPIMINITGEVEFRNVSFAYTNTSDYVIKNLSFKIEKGKKTAIVGTSGSGKSTLIKLLLGLYEPTEGEIFYDGVNLKDIDKTELRKQIGVVPQDMTLFNKTILDNIVLNSEKIDMELIKNATDIAHISREIDDMPMKYNTLLSDMGMNLSGGQRQRIVLARAVVNNPKLVLLDEATSSLDTINERKISQYFEKNGSTRIVVAHRMSTIIDSDKILVLDNGYLVEHGTHKELLQENKVYAKLFNSKKNNAYKSA
ncbi:peptidase domain-containing ABC transporter [Pseudobacteroides cellulosolvens]|uniref:Xenobiotic-transporting ATPase n=1 Tax=Pseudobacteroides cellulosolvens ATCC 35603 = DSM 2933 TaxID=398512 RepID=A0A0L6JTD7_9FIRM|nr:peptidase domain-containing ABC transporter [Pseudobacteroides cellulosolvens]KNY28945.1 Xenobiotic-transporting ATPase [Pseudobacteroides cellulosolvens ATCC 35603 = DSM 2933]